MINRYLDELFGDHVGFVAVAYKDQGNSWQETSFAWPADRRKLTGWAKVHQDANLFICPGLRGTEVRKKNDGIWLSWLWADVDWDKVPDSKLTAVEKRIAEVGTMIVESGSTGKGGRKNVHVYVKLTETLPVEQFNFDNTWLRDYLYADNKQADNSLLRIPGSKNWKTTKGTGVILTTTGHWNQVSPSSYRGTQSYKDTKVIDIARGDADWKVADTKAVKSKHKRMARMSEDEAEGRYGSRHKAVWAVTGDLYHAGYEDDVIHTLMDDFPPAEAKNLDEHGSYDVHKDVAKRLAYERAGEPVIDQPDQESVSSDDEFEVVESTPEDDAAERSQRVANLAEQYIITQEARDLAAEMRATEQFTPPPMNATRILTEFENMPIEPNPMLIEGMWSARGNVVLTAQYKTGKTAFIMGTIAPAICDGEDFLGQFKVNVGAEGARMGHWNLEMDDQYLGDQYIRPVGIKNKDNMRWISLRGYTISFLTPVGRAWTIAWLVQNEIKVWTMDSFSALCTMAGINENDNGEVAALMRAIDEIKRAAGVDAFLILAHTGRQKQEEGKERARAASHIDEWPDHRWVMTRDGKEDVRALMAEGRGPRLETTVLTYDPKTHRSKLGDVKPKIVLAAAGGPQETILQIVRDQPGIHIGSERGKTGLFVEAKAAGVKYWSHFDEAMTELKLAEKIFIRTGRARGQLGGKDTRLVFPRGWDVDAGEFKSGYGPQVPADMEES